MCVCCVCSEDVVRVRATVVEHNKTAKVIVFKKKRRKNYKRTKGYTRVMINASCCYSNLFYASCVNIRAFSLLTVLSPPCAGHRQPISVLRINSILLNTVQ